VLAGAFAALALCAAPDSFAAGYLSQIGMLQFLTGLANLLPLGPMDGTKILQAWRACVSCGSPG
jgi:Zn-dependent protease